MARIWFKLRDGRVRVGTYEGEQLEAQLAGVFRPEVEDWGFGNPPETQEELALRSRREPDKKRARAISLALWVEVLYFEGLSLREAVRRVMIAVGPPPNWRKNGRTN